MHLGINPHNLAPQAGAAIAIWRLMFSTPMFCFALAAVIYFLCGLPGIGFLLHLMLIGYLAPIALWVGMLLLLVGGCIGQYSRAVLLIPLGFVAANAYILIDAYYRVADLKAQVATFNEAQQDLSFTTAPGAVVLVGIDDVPARRLLSATNIERVVELDRKSGEATEYKLFPIATLEKMQRRDTGDVDYSIFDIGSEDKSLLPRRGRRHTFSELQTRYIFETVATLRTAPATTRGISTRVEQVRTIPVEGFENSEIVEYAITRNGRTQLFRHGRAEVPRGFIFPLVVPGNGRPEGRLTDTTFVALDPEERNWPDRLGQILGLEPADFSKFR